MWSVWSKPVQVYLGRNGALLQPGRGPDVWVPIPPTLPWSQRLQRITQAGDPGTLGKKSALSITLSAALCPPVVFTVPEGLRDFGEMEFLAKISVASQWGISPENVRCELAVGVPGLAAAMTQGLYADLVNWAQTLGARITAIQPLWTVATQCQAVQSSAVKALWLQEPDGSTVLALLPGQKATAMHVQNIEMDDGTAHENHAPLRRLITGLDLGADDVLNLWFDPATPSSLSQANLAKIRNEFPVLWAAHWHTERAP